MGDSRGALARVKKYLVDDEARQGYYSGGAMNLGFTGYLRVDHSDRAENKKHIAERLIKLFGPWDDVAEVYRQYQRVIRLFNKLGGRWVKRGAGEKKRKKHLNAVGETFAS